MFGVWDLGSVVGLVYGAFVIRYQEGALRGVFGISVRVEEGGVSGLGDGGVLVRGPFFMWNSIMGTCRMLP